MNSQIRQITHRVRIQPMRIAPAALQVRSMATQEAARKQTASPAAAVDATPTAIPQPTAITNLVPGQLATAYSFTPLDGKSEKTFVEKAKEFVQHYVHGIKMVFVNRSAAKSVRRAIAAGKTMTRADYQLISRADADIRKLLPFIGILIVLPESIPLVLIFAPGAVPSTCILPSQMDGKRKKVQEKRDNMSDAICASAKAQELYGAETYCSEEKLRQLAGKYGSAFKVENLGKEHLSAYCRFLGLSDFGSQTMLQRRFIRHFDYLRIDDTLICQEGVASLDEHQLRDAVEERGMRSINTSIEEMRAQLQEWLSLNLTKEPANPIPAGLLVFSRVFRNVTPMLNKEMEVAERV